MIGWIDLIEYQLVISQDKNEHNFKIFKFMSSFFKHHVYEIYEIFILPIWYIHVIIMIIPTIWYHIHQ